MIDDEPIVVPEKKGLLGWLGRGRSKAGDIAKLSVLAEQLRAISPGSRAEVIASMAEFFDRHDLPVCEEALAIAHSYVTDEDRLLIKLIDERERKGQPITVDWIRKLRGVGQEEADVVELNRTFEKIEQQLIDFGATASAARKATQDYGVSLEVHAEQLDNEVDVQMSVAEILGVVRSMIYRTSEMEKQMARSEKQSRELRDNLEAALRSADEDELTGVPNRRAFEKMFEQEYCQAREACDPLVVAFCDIDYFKKINDTHGHDTGDRVLKAVAGALARNSSERCFIARHGGEEFVVLYRGKTLDEATALLDETREALSQRRFVDRSTDKPIGHVTFSAGISDVFAYSDRSAALKAADTALYWAKEHGRNQIAQAEL